MEVAASGAMLNRSARQANRAELMQGDYSVLAAGEVGDRGIQVRLGERTTPNVAFSPTLRHEAMVEGETLRLSDAL